LKIDRQVECRFFEMAFIPMKSKIRNPNFKIEVPPNRKPLNPSHGLLPRKQARTPYRKQISHQPFWALDVTIIETGEQG